MSCLVVAAALWASADVSLAPESYQTVKSGTCASAGGESISDLAACTAAGAELSTNSRAWNYSMNWNMHPGVTGINGGRVTNIHERDSIDYPSGCVVTSSGSLYFNTNDTGKNCGTQVAKRVLASGTTRLSTYYCVCRFATVTPLLCQAATYAEDTTGYAGPYPYGSYDDVLVWNVFVLANDAICQLWLDAGHNCSTKWEDVCATAHPEGAASNSKTVSTVGCSQCLTTPLSSEVYYYQIVQSGTCASAGGESISTGHLGWRVHDGGESISDLTACTAAAAELSIAWTWNQVVNSPNDPSGCIHRTIRADRRLYFNQRASGRDCGYGSWHCVCRFTTAYSPSPPASPPRPPDYGCWQASALSESCDTRCANLGGCSEQDTFLHSDEIDSAAEVKVLFEGLTGQTCGSPTTMYTWDSVPLFYQGGNMHCAAKTGATSAADFDCAVSNPSAKRLCWCSSCASPPPFPPGNLPPSPPPPSYVKLATDGECQGWSIQKAGTTAGACQDLCDLSDKCGATTFMQSSADNCATRRPAKLPAARPAAPPAPPPHRSP